MVSQMVMTEVPPYKSLLSPRNILQLPQDPEKEKKKQAKKIK